MNIDIDNSKVGVDISNETKDIFLETNNFDAELEENNLSVSNSSDNLDINFGISKIISYEKNHANLQNLDFESSGHTGFQKAGDYALKNEIPKVPTKTSQLENDSNFIEDANYVHTDNNFTDKDKSKLNEATTIEDMTEYIEEHKEELKGEPGENGIDGKDGYTPVKGIDYYTEADKQEMVQLVLDEIPSSEGVGY